MPVASALEAALRRDRFVVVGGLIGIILLAWFHLLRGAGMDLRAMGDMSMPMAAMPWSGTPVSARSTSPVVAAPLARC